MDGWWCARWRKQRAHGGCRAADLDQGRGLALEAAKSHKSAKNIFFKHPKGPKGGSGRLVLTHAVLAFHSEVKKPMPSSRTKRNTFICSGPPTEGIFEIYDLEISQNEVHTAPAPLERVSSFATGWYSAPRLTSLARWSHTGQKTSVEVSGRDFEKQKWFPRPYNGPT